MVIPGDNRTVENGFILLRAQIGSYLTDDFVETSRSCPWTVINFWNPETEFHFTGW